MSFQRKILNLVPCICQSGCTPMTVASEKSHLSIVSLLLSKGADPNIQEVSLLSVSSKFYQS